jgi:hypothetical protein
MVEVTHENLKKWGGKQFFDSPLKRAPMRYCGTAALRHCGTAALRHCGNQLEAIAAHPTRPGC